MEKINGFRFLQIMVTLKRLIMSIELIYNLTSAICKTENFCKLTAPFTCGRIICLRHVYFVNEMTWHYFKHWCFPCIISFCLSVLPHQLLCRIHEAFMVVSILSIGLDRSIIKSSKSIWCRTADLLRIWIDYSVPITISVTN